ncbi:MAG: FecR domain-containing protein [Saccharofermentans sp.]|nr:FecR domain-containing protein [Saccharofermentans sp.]
MVLVEKFKSLPAKNKVILVSTVAAVLIAVILVCVVMTQGYYAATMRLLRVEGTVNIEDANGNPRSVLENVRFSSGEALSTGSDGLASVGLDDTKIVTLESDSRVEFTKSRNMLELNLTQVGLYFEVTEHLSPDETFDIRTSTMTVGIRGTSGYVFYDDDGREALVITDGCVHVVATNPDTGEMRETDVHGGYSVKVYLYDESRPEGSVEFFLEEFEEDEIPGFPLQMLAENTELLDRVCEYTGWDSTGILALIEEISGTETTEAVEETLETEASSAAGGEVVQDGSAPTPEPEVSPTDTSTPSPVPTGDLTATPVPTVTTSPTPTATGTPTPTPSATTTPRPSAIPSPSPSPTPAPTPVVEPSAPSGYEHNSDGWGSSYEGHEVYIAVVDRSDVPELLAYRFYVDGTWVSGSYEHEIYYVDDPYDPTYQITRERDVYYYRSQTGDRIIYYACNDHEK